MQTLFSKSVFAGSKQKRKVYCESGCNVLVVKNATFYDSDEENAANLTVLGWQIFYFNRRLKRPVFEDEAALQKPWNLTLLSHG